MALGCCCIAIFLVWLAVAQAIYGETIRLRAGGLDAAFRSTSVTTPAGWTLIVVGNGVGFLFAVAGLRPLSVVSFPLLLDRDVGAAERGAHLDSEAVPQIR